MAASEKSIAVSMKSGLRDRNNIDLRVKAAVEQKVSMKSGLRDRNNKKPYRKKNDRKIRLNEVRS